MNYKGYPGVARVDEEAGVIRGEVVNTRDTITFQGRTVDEAAAEFRASVDDYLEFCASLGREPEKPFSGKFLVRLSPETHRDLTAIAQSRGVSVNRLVSDQLERLVRTSPVEPVRKARGSGKNESVRPRAAKSKTSVK